MKIEEKKLEGKCSDKGKKGVAQPEKRLYLGF